jgi:hypothetical protein
MLVLSPQTNWQMQSRRFPYSSKLVFIWFCCGLEYSQYSQNFYFRNNEVVLNYVESSKVDYTYSSADLLSILNSITSLKTKMSIIEHIAPRLTDPKRYQTEIMEMFRFVQDKEKVEGLLRARSQSLNAGVFKKTEGITSATGGTGSSASVSSPGRSPASPGRGLGLGGAGGRGGGAGRGVTSPLAQSSSIRSIFRVASESSPSAPISENDGEEDS